MIYENVKKATFLSRPNRFIAVCEIDGKKENCHVKNTGRCRELLIPGATVYIDKSKNSERKTKYDLIAVEKGDILINIDSSAPNKVFEEWLSSGGLFEDPITIFPEKKYKKSRFDFYIIKGNKKIFIEVKGVTLEENGVLLFPDAPTERGVKHIYELCEASDEGYDSYIAFIIQMEKAEYFTPNRKTHSEFADALIYAKDHGVNILCYSTYVTPELIKINTPIPIKFT